MARKDQFQPAGWREREPAVALRYKSNVIGGWLPSLTFALGGATCLVKEKTPEQVRFERDFAFVAGMSGDQETVTHIRESLRSADIRCTYEGSVVYDLFVDRTKVERAVQLLRAEKAKGWQIMFPDELQRLNRRWSRYLRRVVAAIARVRLGVARLRRR